MNPADPCDTRPKACGRLEEEGKCFQGGEPRRVRRVHNQWWPWGHRRPVLRVWLGSWGGLGPRALDSGRGVRRCPRAFLAQEGGTRSRGSWGRGKGGG